MSVPNGGTFTLWLEPGTAATIRAVNCSAELLGYTTEEMLADPALFARVIHTDDADIAAVLFGNSPLAGVHVFNIRLRHADGRFRCCRGEAEDHPDAGGRWREIRLQDARLLAGKVDVDAMMLNFRAMMESSAGSTIASIRCAMRLARSSVCLG